MPEKNERDEQRLDRKNLEAVALSWPRIQTLIRREFVYRSISGSPDDLAEDTDSLAALNWQPSVVLLLQADICDLKISDQTAGNSRLYEKLLQWFAVNNSGWAPGSVQENVFAVKTGEREVVLLLPLAGFPEGANIRQAVKRQAGELQRYLEKELAFTVTIAIGPLCRRWPELRQAYQDAQKALKYKFYLGNGSMIHCQDYQWSDKGHQAAFIDHETKLLSALRGGEWEQVTSITEQLLARIRQTQQVKPDTLKVRILEMLTVVSRAAVELGGDPDVLLDLKVRAGDEIERISTIRELTGWLSGVLATICTLLAEKQQDNMVRAVSQARHYIDKHYFMDISLEELAKIVYLSPFYLSRGFTEQTGATFTEYLKSVRVRKAQTLLMATNRPVAEVAASVGYADPNYFSRVFKAVTGKTPLQYRQGKQHTKA